MKKITYNISWTQSLDNWNTTHIVKLLEEARLKAIELENQLIETQLNSNDLSQAMSVISAIKSKV
jgi:hypothetical protein